MLEKLCIKNFQAHQNLEIDLDPCITTIVGPSDVGKSSILRALRWVCMNRPSGEAFIRDGEKRAEVIARFDGTEIARFKGGGSNSYHEDPSDGSSRSLAFAFGTEVPEGIAKLLNVGPVNFQQQHDSPFWLADTGGQVSRNLNAVINLDVIDSALANAAQHLARTKAVLETAEERWQKAKADKKKLAWVPKAERALMRLVDREGQYSKVLRRTEALVDAIGKIHRQRRKLDRARSAAVAIRVVVVAGKAVEQTRALQCRLGGILKQVKRLGMIEVPDTTDLEKTAIIYRERIKRRMALNAKIRVILGKTVDSKDKKKEAEIAALKLKELIGDQCPLCGAAIKGE